jgi:phosphate starvation-inducible protein PhoH
MKAKPPYQTLNHRVDLESKHESSLQEHKTPYLFRRDLEIFLKIEIIPRGNSLILNGSQESITYAIQFFQHLEENFKNRPDKEDFDAFDIHYLIKSREEGQPWNPTEKILNNFKGKPIFPKTSNQQKFVESHY